MQYQLLGKFTDPNNYANEALSIRSYYGPLIQNDELKCFAVMEPGTPEIREYLFTFNIPKGKIAFQPNTQPLHKRGRSLYTINSINAALREEGLPAGSPIDWRQYDKCLLTTQGIHLQVQRIEFICKA
jgi:hypothetical protein